MPSVKPIPDGYHSLQPYLMFTNTAQAIAFYTTVFGAVERFRMPEPGGRISHAEIQIGDCVVMMADEAPAIEAWSVEHFGGSPISLMLYVEDCDAVFKKALAAGAISQREPADQPYGDRICGIKDPFGYRWYVATHIQDLSQAEMVAAVNAPSAA
jgi:PhnB protein